MKNTKTVTKRIEPSNIYGVLAGQISKPVLLGIVEKETEIDEIITEYNKVFGVKNIGYFSIRLTRKEYAEAKELAYGHLFAALYRPIATVIMGLKTTKR